MTPLTFDTAVGLAREVIAGREDHHYQRPPESIDVCRYVHGDEPGCVVGRMLHRAGYSIEALRGFDTTFTTISDLLRADRVAHDGDTRLLRFLWALQDYQDTGQSWGDALRSALEIAEHATW